MEAIVQEMCLEISILLFKINENREKVNKKSHIFLLKIEKLTIKYLEKFDSNEILLEYEIASTKVEFSYAK